MANLIVRPKKAEQQRILEETVAKADDAYRPSNTTLNNTSLLVREIKGPALSQARPSKFSNANAIVYAARSMDIPIRVELPGTMIEFSIEKKPIDWQRTDKNRWQNRPKA